MPGIHTGRDERREIFTYRTLLKIARSPANSTLYVHIKAIPYDRWLLVYPTKPDKTEAPCTFTFTFPGPESSSLQRRQDNICNINSVLIKLLPGKAYLTLLLTIVTQGFIPLVTEAARMGTPKTITTEPSLIDVMQGKGKKYQNHERSRRFEGTSLDCGPAVDERENAREGLCQSADKLAHSFLPSYTVLIKSLHDIYATARMMKGKKGITQETVLGFKHTGRFLKRNNRNTTLEEVPDDVASIEVTRAFQYQSRRRLSVRSRRLTMSRRMDEHGNTRRLPTHGVPSLEYTTRVVAFDQVDDHQEQDRLHPAFEQQDSCPDLSISDDDHVSAWLPLPDGEEVINSDTTMVDTNGDTSEQDPESYDLFCQVSEGNESSASSNENRELESTSEPLVPDPTNRACLIDSELPTTTTFDEEVVRRPEYPSEDASRKRKRSP
jgi:hypothetical protein